MKKIILFILPLLCFHPSVLFAQTYRILLKEDFGTSNRNPNASPANVILPGTTTYNPKTVSASTVPTSTNYPYVDDGEYAVVDSLRPFGWYKNTGGQIWQYGYDHTTDAAGTKGYMMLINADPTHLGETNGKYYQYSTSVFDIPGAQYAIDFWAANTLEYKVSGAGSLPAATYKPAYIGLAVRNTQNGSGTLYNSQTWVLPRIAPGVNTYDTIPWQNNSLNFTLDVNYNSSNPLYFNFYNSDPSTYSCATCGNDLVLDDLTIKMVVTTISGKIFNDINGNGILDGSETGMNGITTPLYAVLTKSNGTVISIVPVDANGNYLFDETANANTGVPAIPSDVGMKITFSTAMPAIGSVVTTPTLPAGYAITKENINGAAGAADNVASDGIINLTNTSSNIANLNFGIEQPPTAGGGTNTARNPGSTTPVTVPANTFTNTASSTDPTASPNGVTSIRITALPTGAASISINGVTYGPGFTAFPAGGVTVPTDAGGTPTQAITVDPSSTGPTTVTIPFVAIDAAGKESTNTGSAVMSFTVPLSGTVFNDANGLRGTPVNTVDGTPTNTGVTPLYAVLYDRTQNKVTGIQTVPAGGTYSFDVTGNNYDVYLTTTLPTLNQTATPAITLPAGWVNTGEFVGTGAGNDGTVNGILPIGVVTDPVSNANFGIDRTPDSQPVTTTVGNPAQNSFTTLNGGSNPPFFTGSDPEDQPTSGTLSGKTVGITSLPTKGELWYNGSKITFGQNGTTAPSLANPFSIPNFVPSLMQVKFTGSGYSSLSFNYAYIDAAGIIDPTPATYTLNWSVPLPLKLRGLTAQMIGDCSVRLSWETMNEQALEKFIVAYSVDALHFTEVGSVKSQNKPSGGDYTFVYDSPSKGIGYYRLKITESDGSFTNSDIVSCFNNCMQPGQIRISPNPVKDIVTIAGLSSHAVIRVFDLLGRLQYIQSVAGGDNEKIDLHHLPAATYLLKITDEAGMVFTQIRLIKQ